MNKTNEYYKNKRKITAKELIGSKYAGKSLDEIKDNIISAFSIICNDTIENGVDVLLSDEKTHHFSMKIQDQINIMMLIKLVNIDDAYIPYHEDGDVYKYYSSSDFQKIVSAMESHKLFHLSYFASLKKYIRSLSNLNDIININYGDDIPELFCSEVLNDFCE